VKINQLLTKLQALVADPADQVPANFFSVLEWADKWKISRSHAAKLLAAGVESGDIEMRKFRVRRGEHLYRSPLYRAL
jgi:hypothetical protein